jgi:hypothetical protein
MERHQRVLISVITVIAALAIPLRRGRAAQEQPQPKPGAPASTTVTANYNFLIASGFLCDPPNPDVCPAVARAGNGERIEISGAGTLGPAGKSVNCRRRFHREDN